MISVESNKEIAACKEVIVDGAIGKIKEAAVRAVAVITAARVVVAIFMVAKAVEAIMAARVATAEVAITVAKAAEATMEARVVMVEEVITVAKVAEVTTEARAVMVEEVIMAARAVVETGALEARVAAAAGVQEVETIRVQVADNHLLDMAMREAAGAK